MADLIDRQAAIDALQKEINKGIPPFNDVFGSIRAGVRLARNIIEDLPSAQPEQRWIPCGERLPEDDVYVLISKRPNLLSGKKWCVTIAGRFKGARNNLVGWRDIGFGELQDDEILAWMPLPAPYREDTKNETD